MALNVPISVIHLGNLPNVDPTNDQTFSNINSFLGTYGSPANPLSDNVITLLTNGPTGDALFTDNNGTGDTIEYDIGGGPVVTELDSWIHGPTTDVTFADNTVSTVYVVFAQATTGETFMVVLDGQTDLSAKAIEQISVSTVSSGPVGTQQSVLDDETFVDTGAPTCLTSGTRLSVPGGEEVVERLRQGDLVETVDNGPQPVRWIGKRRYLFTHQTDRHRPVLFPANSLGRGLPYDDLAVSPQHRMCMAACGSDVLVAAKFLTGLSRVRQMHGKPSIDYYTLLFDRHELVIANGYAVESFYPGDMALRLLPALQRREVLDTMAVSDYLRARRFLTRREAIGMVKSLGTAKSCTTYAIGA